jgi:hypothetical protein
MILRRHYGSGPVHLLLALASFAVAGSAVIFALRLRGLPE